PNLFSKEYTLCQRRRGVLNRCRIDASNTWYFLCLRACWEAESGGHTGEYAWHPHYVYGGTGKIKRALVSGKIKWKAMAENKDKRNG
ncbi:hypothetical protein BJ878DRAFT_402496, partial [Calycina marina]